MGYMIGRIAWGVLGLLGLFSIVDLGFGPIVICPQCGTALNAVLGVILVALSLAAFALNRRVENVATR